MANNAPQIHPSSLSIRTPPFTPTQFRESSAIQSNPNRQFIGSNYNANEQSRPNNEIHFSQEFEKIHSRFDGLNNEMKKQFENFRSEVIQENFLNFYLF